MNIQNDAISESIYNMLLSVKNTASRNEKTSIIKDFYSQLSDDDKSLFKQLCINVFSPRFVFNVRKIPEHTSSDIKYTLEDALAHNGILSLLMKRKVTGNEAITTLKHWLSHTSQYTASLIKNCIDKTFDVGADVKTFNKAINEIIVAEHGVMLCEPASEKLLNRISYPAFAQLKYDAMRIELQVYSDVVSLVTRNGNSFGTNNSYLNDTFTSILKEVKNAYALYGYDVSDSNIFLDGELMFIDKNKTHLSRQASNGIATKCQKGTKDTIETNEVLIYCWDVITQEEKDGKIEIPYKIRFKVLEWLIDKHPILKLAETTVIWSLTEAIDVAVKYIHNGFEGAIIKDKDSIWEPKRVKSQIKLKAEIESELRVVGYNIANDNKYSGMVGSLICKTDDNIVQVDVSGMTDSQRKDFIDNSIIGKVITVKHNGLLANKNKEGYSIFLPRLVEVRHDKDTTDTYESIKNSEFVVC
jgi:hypothetical protein